MNVVGLWNLDKQHQPAIENFHMLGSDPDGWFDRVGGGLHEKGVEVRDLPARHADDRAVVGDPREQRTTRCVGESGDFVRPVTAGRALWTIAREFQLLEFPVTVLARAQPVFDLFGPVSRHAAIDPLPSAGLRPCHGWPPPGGSAPARQR